MKASFYICLARNSSVWLSYISLITIEDANFPSAGNKKTNPSRDNPSFNTAFMSSQPIINQRKCDKHTKHPSFFDMGNTCYASSILQSFLSPLTRAVTLNMSLLKKGTTLLWALRRKLSTNKQVPFRLTSNRMSLRSYK